MSVTLKPSQEVTILAELSITGGEVVAEKTTGYIGEKIPFTIKINFNRTITDTDFALYQVHYRGTINGTYVKELDLVFRMEPGASSISKTIHITFSSPGKYVVGGTVALESIPIT